MRIARLMVESEFALRNAAATEGFEFAERTEEPFVRSRVHDESYVRVRLAPTDVRLQRTSAAV